MGIEGGIIECHSCSFRHGFLLDFQDRKEVERVLQRRHQRFKGRLFTLEKWGPEAGCLKAGSVTKDCWVGW